MRRTLLCLSATFLACIAWASPALANHVNCGDVLTQDTTLDSDLVCPGDALDIGADGVTVNLGGYEIRGPGGGTGAIAVDNQGFDEAAVRDGRITGFGLAVRAFSTSRGEISGLTINGLGVWLNGVDNTAVRRNVFVVGDVALTQAESNLVRNNRLDRGRIALGQGHNNVIDRNQISPPPASAGSGISIATDQTTVTRNVVRGGDSGIALGGTGSNVVERNSVQGARVGIMLSSSNHSSVINNYVTDSTEDGIRVGFSRNVLVERNFSHLNGDDGIDIDSIPTTVTRNKAKWNGDLGIEAVGGTTDGGGNKARGNGNPAQCVGVSCS